MSGSLIDVNVSLSRWPTRRLPLDETKRLVDVLQEHDVRQAWACTFDALLHKDIASANARLAKECARHGGKVLTPFGAINLALPEWEEDVRRCAEEHGMRGVRLYPNYHGYTLRDATFERLLGLAVERRLIVQIAVSMEDERMMHPLLRVAPVNVNALLEILPRVAGANVVLLNAQRSVAAPVLAQIMRAGNVLVDIASVEGVGGVENLIKQIPVERVLFGSQSPLQYLESAVLKLRESELEGGELEAVSRGNARRLLEVTSP